jgi:hypothetical protein
VAGSHPWMNQQKIHSYMRHFHLLTIIPFERIEQG